MSDQQISFAEALLPYWQQRRNALIAPARAPVERVFGSIKRLYGRTRMRYYNFRRNYADVYRVATVYDLRRAITILSKPRATSPIAT